MNKGQTKKGYRFPVFYKELQQLLYKVLSMPIFDPISFQYDQDFVCNQE